MRNLFKSLALLLAAALPLEGWAENLLHLYEQALANNASIKSRESSVERAHAQKDQALSRLLPQVVAVGNLAWNDMTQTVTSGTGQRGEFSNQYESSRGLVQAKQALFDLPSFLRWQGAGSAILQTEQELEAVRMGIAADLVDRYFQALEAEDGIGYIQGEQEATESQLNRIRRMYERQMVPVTDLFEVEAYYRTLATRQIEAENAKAVALEKLREITGNPVADVASLVGENFPPVPGEAEHWVQEAGRHNPRLIALQHAIDAADKLISSSRAEHLPQVSLQLSETYSDNAGFDNRQQPRYNVGSVGLQLTVPIYEGGRVDATVRDAAARHEIARQQYLEERRKIERDTRTAYLDARAARARIESTGQEVAARRKVSDAQQKSYELRVSTIVDLLESKKNLLKARFEQSKARYDYIRALVALRLWAGSLTQDDMQDLNGWLAADAGPKTPPSKAVAPVP
jgi:outer membrane protein